MHKFVWLDDNHIGTLEGGIELANRLEWNVTWTEHNGIWRVWSGERLVLETDSREVAEAFMYGFGLAYGVLPESLFEALERAVKKLVSGQQTT